MNRKQGGAHLPQGKDVYIGLGANIGDRLAHMLAARRMLAEGFPSIELAGCSSLYETEPQGGPAGQPRYLNAVLLLRAALKAHELLGVLRQVELRLGRQREVRWGARGIDCDLLLVGSDVIVYDDLVVPHPELVRRPFMLTPLVELSPGLRHPASGLPFRLYLRAAGGWGEPCREAGGRRGVRRLECDAWRRSR